MELSQTSATGSWSQNADLIHLLAQLLEPFMPSFSRKVFKQLNLPPHLSLSDERGEVLQASRPWTILPPSHRIGTPQLLFKELWIKLGGSHTAVVDQIRREPREPYRAGNSGGIHMITRAEALANLEQERLGSREDCSYWESVTPTSGEDWDPQGSRFD
ncbi:unnamed protein product [Arabidopsis halleri]